MATETRILAYPIEMGGKAKMELIAEAETLGMVWTINNFIIALNLDKINDQDYYYATYEAEVFDSNVVVNKLELASELAHESARKEMMASGEILDSDGMWMSDRDSDEDEECEIYTPEAQHIFNEWYDYYITKIEEVSR